MTRMGLWSFTCVQLPAEASDAEWTEEEEEREQPGTSYDRRACFDAQYRSTKSSKAAVRGGGGECGLGARSGRERDRVHGSCGGGHMLACFRAGAINLIVHPALQVTVAGSQSRQLGASTVQPVNSLPRAAFLDGAADQDSGDEPTSPVVTCIGQVRKERMRTPPKTPPKGVVEVGDLRSLKLKREKTLARFESPSVASTSSSARPSKWRQILGTRGTSVQPRNDASEFHVDLNRFSSACSSIAKTAPALKDMKAVPKAHTGTFLAKSLMMLQLECEAHDRASNEEDDEPCETKTREDSLRPNPVAMASRGSTCDEVLLWKRRSGAKPLTLDLKRRSGQRHSVQHACHTAIATSQGE